MSSNRTKIDGEVYIWLPTAPGAKASRADFTVFWLEEGDDRRRVEIGRLKKWRLGAAWEVLPRLGGQRRAAESCMGLARTREAGVGFLMALARSESALTVLDKVRLRIVIDGNDGGIVDRSVGLTPVPHPSPRQPEGTAHAP